MNQFDYDSNTGETSNEFRFKTFWRDLKAKHRISVACSPEACVITNAWTRKICCNTIFAGNFSVDKGLNPLAYNWGIFVNKKWLSMALTKHHDFSSEEQCAIKDFHASGSLITKMLTHGGFNWRLIMDASKDTKVGFDYFWNGSEQPQMTLGFSHDLSKDSEIKGRINQAGKMDVSVRTELKKNWDLTWSMGVDSTAIGGNSDAIFGLAIGGKV